MPSLSTNSEVTLTVSVRNTAGELVDPDTIYLQWKLGPDEDWTTVAQGSLTNSSTGIFSATVTPEDEDGEFQGFPAYLHYRWVMTNPTYVEKGKVALATEECAL